MVSYDRGLLFAVFGGGCFLSDDDRGIHETDGKKKMDGKVNGVNKKGRCLSISLEHKGGYC
jgi:hypothetical protein